MRIEFEFKSNNLDADDQSGVAVWKYVDQVRGEDVEMIVRQSFPTFNAAHGMNALIDAAWRLGEATGYANCERKVLSGLRGI